jgi:hypothetical protein
VAVSGRFPLQGRLAGRPDFHARWVIVLKMRSSASATQERGRARRMALQDAAALLLDDPGTDIDTLVLADVCGCGIRKVRATISIAIFTRSMPIWRPVWNST